MPQPFRFQNITPILTPEKYQDFNTNPTVPPSEMFEELDSPKDARINKEENIFKWFEDRGIHLGNP